MQIHMGHDYGEFKQGDLIVHTATGRTVLVGCSPDNYRDLWITRLYKMNEARTHMEIGRFRYPVTIKGVQAADRAAAKCGVNTSGRWDVAKTKAAIKKGDYYVIRVGTHEEWYAATAI